MFDIDRRQLMALGSFGLGAAALPATSTLANARGFTHNVASGEPGPNSVLLWTRYVGSGEPKLVAEISDTIDFSGARMAGEAVAGPDSDHIAKITATGLSPNRWYFYRFVAPDGSMSPIGRTRTLPDGPVSQFNLGVFSCSNIGFGWFNAYAHAATRNDLDLLIHTGDYLYEYPVGEYPSAMVSGRSMRPAHEIVQLADYRLRYASYRLDRDLQRLHQLFPMISMWDDHETTNDSWTGGAQNHQPETEGDWNVRKRAAERAYREWMPVRDRSGENDWPTAYQIGDLATIFLTESRISGRDKPPSLAEALAGRADLGAALVEFRDKVWLDPSRSMLGGPQEAWLAEGLKNSVGAGTKWQVHAQQCVIGKLVSPKENADWLPPDAPDFVKQRLQVGQAAAGLGLPFNMDAWDGYPAARERLLAAAQEAEANLVVLSGDSHNGWAFDLGNDSGAAGVEFAGHSVTSPGFEAYLRGVPPSDIAAALVRANEQLQWADTGQRGYMSVRLTPERATSTWHFMDGVRQRGVSVAGERIIAVDHGARRLAV